MPVPLSLFLSLSVFCLYLSPAPCGSTQPENGSQVDGGASELNTVHYFFFLHPASNPSTPSLSLLRFLLLWMLKRWLIWGNGSMPRTLCIWRNARSLNANCALDVMSSRCWSVIVAKVSKGSFSQGSRSPGLPFRIIPEEMHSNTLLSASPGL